MENYAKKIRFIYVKASKEDDNKTFAVNLDVCKSMNVPTGVTLEEVYALASYLSLKVERENNFEKFTKRGMGLVHEYMKKYGFTENNDLCAGHHRATYKYAPFTKYSLNVSCPAIEDCVDLFVVDCEFDYFKKTTLHDRYVEWYTTKSTKEKDDLKNNCRNR